MKARLCLFIFLKLLGINSFGQLCLGVVKDTVLYETFGSGAAIFGPALPTGITNYPYTASVPGDGSYTISNQSADAFAGSAFAWIEDGDHTGNTNGYMMVVNADYATGEFYRKKLTGLCPNTKYVFSAWIASVNKPSVLNLCFQYIYPNVKFQLEYPINTIIASTTSGNVPLTTNSSSLAWYNHGLSFVTGPSQTSVDVVMINSAPGGCGNDLVIDDIVLFACLPEITISVNTSTVVCENTDFTLQSAFTQEAYVNPDYQWQFSSDGNNWTDIIGQNQASLTINNANSANAGYYQLLSAGQGNLMTSSCHIQSNVLQIVVENPTAGFSYSTSSCGSNLVTFTDTTNNGSIARLWDLGDGSTSISQTFNHQYLGTGPYDAKLTITTPNGCKDSVTKTLSFSLPPVASFSVASVCAGSASQFVDLSSGGTLSSWKWYFGDGSTSNTSNPSHTYSISSIDKIYTVSLVVESGGCKDSTSQLTTVFGSPNVGFTYNAPLCGGGSATFTDTTSIVNGIRLWTLGDGSISTSQTFNHQYSGTGPYNVKLLVETLNGCKDSVTKIISFSSTVVANFSVSPVCAGSMAKFNELSSGGVITSWKWYFGDGSTSISPNPNYTYSVSPSDITYTVSLVVSASDCKDSISKTITIYANPVADFFADSVCFGSQTQFTDNSQGFVYSYWWDFNNDWLPEDTLLSNPSYQMLITGNTVVTHIVATNPVANVFCKDTIQKTVYVYPLPQASFSVSNVCLGQSIILNASSSISANTPTYEWDLGDGAVANSMITSHSYAAAGTYAITLQIIENTVAQCTSVSQQTVQIHSLPQVEINASSTCFGDATSLSALTLSGSSINQWNWDLNNTINSIEANGQTISHTYNTKGNQTIRLIISSQDNCRDTITKTIYVNDLPIPQFSVDKQSGCSDLCVSFSDNSIATSPSSITQWYWNLGDGSLINTSTPAQQPHCYSNSTSNQLEQYSITLTVKTDSGCVATLTKTNYITVFPIPIANYVTTPSSASILESSISFVNTSTDYTKWWWYFGDTLLLDSVNQHPNYIYKSEIPKQYTTFLIIENQYGCRDTSAMLVEIKPDFVFYMPNAFTPNDDNVNNTFTGAGIGIVDYEMWIYDRWDNMIYYTNSINRGWDGRAKGQQETVLQDIYVWKVILRDVLGKPHEYVGHVTVIK